MNRHALTRTALVATLLVALIGCTNANVALNDAKTPLEYRRENQTRAAMFSGVRAFRTEPEPPTTQNTWTYPRKSGEIPPTDSDGYFVGLALSGGGSRSANFSAACMFQLERLGLLQKVDYISSVSGGSLPAAYYCLHGAEWNPDTVQQRLTHAFASDLISESLLPWNWIGMTFSDLDRSDLLAGIFQRELYSREGRGLTFADLRPDRPRLLINTTDLQSGRRFVFSNESFDELNSDLSKYPIANAVAASSAVPVLLHPVTLRDYSTTFKQYRHLIDGGITDNLGIETLLDTYAGQIVAAQKDHRPDPYPNGAVFVVIDAHTKFNAELSSESDVGTLENLKVAMGLTGSSMVQRVNTANMADIILRGAPDDMPAKQLREQLHELQTTGYLDLIDRPGHHIRVIYLSLSQVNELKNLPFGNFSESLNGIATYFNITPREAYRLYQAAELLVRDKFEEKIRRIVADLGRDRGKIQNSKDE